MSIPCYRQYGGGFNALSSQKKGTLLIDNLIITYKLPSMEI